MTIPVEPLHEFAAALDGKRIFVTGGTGFFGRSLLDLLGQGACPGAQWHLLSRDPEAFRRRCPWADLPQVHLIRGDVRDFVFPECHFDLIWHGAAPAVTDLPPGEMRRNGEINLVLTDGTRLHLLSFPNDETMQQEAALLSRWLGGVAVWQNGGL